MSEKDMKKFPCLRLRARADQERSNGRYGDRASAADPLSRSQEKGRQDRTTLKVGAETQEADRAPLRVLQDFVQRTLCL